MSEQITSEAVANASPIETALNDLSKIENRAAISRLAGMFSFIGVSIFTGLAVYSGIKGYGTLAGAESGSALLNLGVSLYNYNDASSHDIKAAVQRSVILQHNLR